MTGPVVVTGASSGIGRACVERLAKAGVRTFPTVRKDADALALTQAFGPLVEPVLADVTDAGSLARAAAADDAPQPAQEGTFPGPASDNRRPASAGTATASKIRPLSDNTKV